MPLVPALPSLTGTRDSGTSFRLSTPAPMAGQRPARTEVTVAKMNWDGAAARDRVRLRGGDRVEADLSHGQPTVRHEHQWSAWSTPPFGTRPQRQCKSCGQLESQKQHRHRWTTWAPSSVRGYDEQRCVSCGHVKRRVKKPPVKSMMRPLPGSKARPPAAAAKESVRIQAKLSAADEPLDWAIHAIKPRTSHAGFSCTCPWMGTAKAKTVIEAARLHESQWQGMRPATRRRWDAAAREAVNTERDK